METLAQDGNYQLGDMWAQLLGPADETFRRPFGVVLVGWRHVFGQGGIPAGHDRTGMGRLALLVIEDFQGVFGRAEVDFLVDQGVGHAVEVFLELDMVVNVHPGFLPEGKFVGLSREGSQRRPVQGLEEFAAGLAEVPHFPIVEVAQQLSNAGVQVRQTEEGPIAQAGRDPALDDLDADFHFGFVLGFAHPGWDHGDPVVLGEILVSRIEVRFVATRALDPGLEIVWDDDFRQATEEGQSAHVAANPVPQVLLPLGFDVSVTAGTQHGDEELGLADFIRLRVDDGNGLAGVIDKQFFPGLVRLAHRGLQMLGPFPIVLTELGVGVAVRVGFAILDPQQPQRHPGPTQLGVESGPVRLGNDPPGGRRRLGKEPPVQGLFIQLVRQWPSEADRLGALDIVADRAGGDATTLGDSAMGESTLPLQSQDFMDFPHG